MTSSESDKSESEKSSEKDEEDTKKPKVGDVVAKRYKIHKKLGEGSFGLVLEVIDIKTDDHYAMKIELEKPPTDEPGLDLEGDMLKRLMGYEHMLRYVDSGALMPSSHSFLVMQLAGHNLEDLRKHCPQQRFSGSTTLRIGQQCMHAIETMHVFGFLHRDIKPPNFAMGYSEQEKRTVFLLDFGMVRRYRLKDGAIRPPRPKALFRGTYQYASVNAHNNVDLGRVDDMWSWLYSIVQMRIGKLPWRKVKGKEEVGEAKAATKKEDLLMEMDPEYGAIYDNLTALKYADEPAYGKYRELFAKIVQRKNYSFQAPFDWEEGGEHFKHTLYVRPTPHPYYGRKKPQKK